MEITTFTNGIIKSFLGLISCFPQYILIYKLKSTKGFSIIYVAIDIIGSLFAILQILVDYHAFGNGTGFWSELNWTKFLMHWTSITGFSVFLFQHWYYKYFYKLENLVVASSDEIVIDERIITCPNDLDMKTETKNILGVSSNNTNSDLVLEKVGRQAYIKSAGSLKSLISVEELPLLTS